MFKAIAKKIKPIQGLTTNNDSLKNKLLKGAVGSFGLKISSSGFAFIMSIIFARFLGTVGLGTYSYAITWANLLSIPAKLGIDQLLIREVAVYRAKSQWGLMGGVLRWANLTVLVASIIFAFGGLAVAWNLKSDSDPALLLAIAIAMIHIPIVSLRSLRLGAMKGLHRIVLGQMPDMLFSPCIVISLTLLSCFLFRESFNVYWVLIIKIFALLITFFTGAFWLVRSLPKEVIQIKPEFKVKQWLLAAIPFMFLGTTQLITSRIDVIMLGEIKGVKAVGVYAVIVGITSLTIFIYQASVSVLAPHIATLYSEGKLKQLEKLLQKSVIAVFLLTFLFGGTIMLLGKYLLLIFGSEFIIGRTAMNILILGKMFHAFTGPVDLVLNMTGYQNYTAMTVGLTAVLNIILNAILIPKWGISGAAIATTTSMVVINIVNVIFMHKVINISLYSFFQFKKT